MKKGRKALGFWLLLASFFAFLGSVLWTSQRLLKVTYVTAGIEELPERLDGMRILLISDLHAKSAEKVGLNIWETIRGLDFDIVAITGDIVDRNAYQLEPHLPYIKELADKYPVFFCEGNHDHYSMDKIGRELEKCGVTVLKSQKVDFDANGEPIEIIGLSDWYTADLEDSARLFGETDKFRLVLTHQPQHIDYVDVGGAPCFVLAGHTHGGQWRFPFFKTIYAPGQGFFPKYGNGLYELSEDGLAKMFVSKGIGSTGKAPFRFWNRPEIAVIELTNNRAK